MGGLSSDLSHSQADRSQLLLPVIDLVDVVRREFFTGSLWWCWLTQGQRLQISSVIRLFSAPVRAPLAPISQVDPTVLDKFLVPFPLTRPGTSSDIVIVSIRERRGSLQSGRLWRQLSCCCCWCCGVMMMVMVVVVVVMVVRNL